MIAIAVAVTGIVAGMVIAPAAGAQPTAEPSTYQGRDVVVMRRILTPPNGRPTATPTPVATPTPEATPTPSPQAEPAGTWTVGTWTFGSTAPTCSDGATRTRTVACIADGVTVADARCTDAKPEGVQVVERHGGCTSDWTTGEYGSFSPTCSASSVRTRTVRCQRSGGDSVPAIVEDGLCAAPRPEAIDTAAYLAGCTNTWVYGAWTVYDSTCSAAAGRTRTAECRRSDPSNPGLILPADVVSDQCNANDREPLSEEKPIYSDCAGVLTNANFQAMNLSGWSTSGTVNLFADGTNYSARLRADATISQDLQTYPVSYVVIFACYASADSPVRMSWNGVHVGVCGTGENQNWTTRSLVVVGVAGTSHISFTSTANNRRVDDVVVAVAP